MESKKEKIIKKIIQEKIKDATEFLKREEKELLALLNKKSTFWNYEMISSLQHQIGYMTAMKYGMKEILELVEMSHEEILEEMKEWERIEKQNKAHMKEVFASIEKDIKKNKQKKAVKKK